jgi:hypothetical protein
MKKLPNAPEFGIETSKLDVDENEFVTKVKPQPQPVKGFLEAAGGKLEKKVTKP